MRRLTYLVIFVMVITSFSSAPAYGLGTLDQQQPTIDTSVGGIAVGGASAQILAQTFTAGITGSLTEVALPVACDDTPGNTLTIEIRAIGSGVPGSTTLASTAVAASTLPPWLFPTPPAFRTFSFSSPASVVAGTQYVLYLSAGSCGVFQGPVGDSYAGGDLYFYAVYNAKWVRNCDFVGGRCDLPFKTYVTPATADLGVTVTSSVSSAFGTTQQYWYDVTLTNYGPGVPSFSGVTLSPSANLRVDGYPILYCTNTTSLTCGVANLGVNQSLTFRIFVTAQYGTSGSLSATTQGTLPDPNGANNSASATTLIMPVVDMKVDSLAAYQGSSPTAVTQVGVGDAYYYKAVIRNNGVYDANNAVASMQLPTGTTFVGISGPAALGPAALFCGQDTTPQLYGCNFGKLTPGSTATMFLQVTAPTVAGPVSATVRASANEPETDTSNDTATLQISVVGQYVTASVFPGGTVSTATSGGATASDPVQTTVTTPNPGTVTIREVPTTAQNAISGYNLIDQQVFITAPNATPGNPLVLVFEIDKSKLYPPTASTITILRNGAAIGSCPGQTTASPDPCVSSRTTLASGNVQLTVLTSAASRWNFGIHLPYAFTGFFEPLDGKTTAQAGSTLPVKFSLAGDQGIGVVASAESRPCTGGAGEAIAAPGNSVLTYDAASDRYQLNWKTKKVWAGSCRELALTLMDGSTHTTRVSFR